MKSTKRSSQWDWTDPVNPRPKEKAIKMDMNKANEESEQFDPITDMGVPDMKELRAKIKQMAKEGRERERNAQK